jgi:acetyl/propionyl-CoA carboxylase alpha subunit
MNMTVRGLLIANRGEIAVRIARTCREMGIRSIGVFSDADAGALHVAACDEAVAIGGDTPATSYLVVDKLLEAARVSGADAVHPGFGFLAENADFAQAVMDAGLVWVGPSPEAIAAMGDKIEAKRRMEQAGVPVLPGLTVDGDVPDNVADVVGFPLIVKAAAGGGGKGMRVVESHDDLEEAITSARREAAGAFGDDRVFLERYVADPRHVEVQVIGDVDGTVLHLFERECSIQRRHQKVIEESPAPTLADAVRDRLFAAAVAAAEAIDYRGAGTVEFVVDDAALRAGEADVAWFLEMNTRLQVEHPVTEEVTGLDLVRLQLLVAQGHGTGLTQNDIARTGAAIEVRLYAENPASGYLPASGTLGGFRPAGDIRWDIGIREGDVVSTFYDPMIAKAIAWAPTRPEAAAKLAASLEQTVVQGVVTNRDLLVHVLRHDAFLRGATTTHYLDTHFPSDHDRAFPPPPDLARLAVVVVVAVTSAGGDTPLPSVPRGFSNVPAEPEPTVFTVGGSEVRATHVWDRAGALVTVDGVEHSVEVVDADGPIRRVRIDDRVLAVTVHQFHDSVQVVLPQGNVTLFRHPRFPARATAEEPGATLAPMPGSVVTVEVEVGQRVSAGDLLVVVEAMKMEHRIHAPLDGVVEAVRVTAGQQVDAGDVLVVIEPEGSDDTD